MEKRFTCRVCGDKVPYIFGTGMPDGKWVCACCGGEVEINSRRRKNFNIPDEMDSVFIATRMNYFKEQRGFSRLFLVDENKFEEKSKNYKDARMIRLSKDEVDEIAFYANRAFVAKKSWRMKYEIYQNVAFDMMLQMKWKLQDEATMEAMMRETWARYRVCAGSLMESAIRRGKPDYEILRALLETMAENKAESETVATN